MQLRTNWNAHEHGREKEALDDRRPCRVAWICERQVHAYATESALCARASRCSNGEAKLRVQFAWALKFLGACPVTPSSRFLIHSAVICRNFYMWELILILNWYGLYWNSWIESDAELKKEEEYLSISL